MNKETAIKQVHADAVARYDEWFQSEVKSLISYVAEYSDKLEKIKASLVALQYDPPKPVDLT